MKIIISVARFLFSLRIEIKKLSTNSAREGMCKLAAYARLKAHVILQR